MKRLLTIAAFFCITLSLSAQHRINSFFDELGTVRIETQELDENADTIATIFHRTDDVVWSRIVYRIIDMRFKQNFQLYFPTNPDDPRYWSLFRLIVDAVANGRVNSDGATEYLPLYRKNFRGIKPKFSEEDLIQRNLNMQMVFGVDVDENISIDTEDDFLVVYDSINDNLWFNNFSYSGYIRNQIKYLTMEIMFFDKHTSRFYQKIIAIAPLNSAMSSAADPYDNLVAQVRFWILFDQLRPFMARKYMIPLNNSSKRVTFDNFFAEHLYTSYIVGDDNMFDRMIVQGQKVLTEEFVHRDQERIASELLNTELDLWEY
jgi:gliding motility associated protien GldN